jgi:hypothetical protein
MAAAAAILKLDRHFRYCDFQTQHTILCLCANFHQNRMVIADFTAFTCISNMAAATILKAVGHFLVAFLTMAGRHETTQ